MEALDTSKCLPGLLEKCSWQANWTSLLLRRYREPLATEPFETQPVPSLSIVLVKSGATRIESFTGGRWLSSNYLPGDLGMTPPGQTSRLRWRGREHHVTLQLQLPHGLLLEAADELGIEVGRAMDGLNILSVRDPLVQHAIVALEQGLERGLPDLYAESAARLLAFHLVAKDAIRFRSEGRASIILERIDDFMHAHLGQAISLTEIANAAGRSAYQIIRMTKRGWGETPFQHLTRLRMENAKKLLEQSDATTLSVALECGYTNPSHFAIAFRRLIGVSPSRYRSLHKQA